MSEAELISARLTDYAIVLSGPVIENPTENGKYHVFIDSKFNEKINESALNTILSKLKTEFSARGSAVEFVVSGRNYGDIEIVAKAIADRTLPGAVESCFTEFSNGSFTIWMMPTRPLLDTEIATVEDRLRAYMESVRLKLASVYSTITENLPSRMACLSFIRIKAPVRLEEIASGMLERGFSVPSAEWMSKNLDSLRKGGLVIRLKSGRYALTLSALKALGSAKNASSPDIIRMLDLARRGD